MFSLLRPFVFSLDPEKAHDIAIKSLKYNFLPNKLCRTFFATPPAATLDAVSRADCRPPPLKSLMPYFLK